MTEELITLTEAADLCGLSPATLRSAIFRKRLQGQRRGRDLFTTRAWLVDYLQSRQTRKSAGTIPGGN